MEIPWNADIGQNKNLLKRYSRQIDIFQLSLALQKVAFMSEQIECKSSFFYFENPTMRGLYKSLENWQNTTQKHILSLSIHQDHGNFCCILLADSRELIPSPPQLTLFEADMNRFRRKALKHIGVGVEFSSHAIKPEKILSIQMKLEKCKTPVEVESVFREAFMAE